VARIAAIAAIVLGVIGRGRGSSGEGFATAGLILGLTSVLLYLVIFPRRDVLVPGALTDR